MERMRHERRAPAAILAAVIGVLVVSCDRNPTSPTPSVTQAPTPQAATVVRVEVVGPSSVEPGTSAQFTANAIKSDGTVENVTAAAQWTALGPVFRIESPGVVRAVNRGESTITARYQSRTGSTRVFSLPAGTFRLSGTVTDTGVPLGGVTVAVIGGTGEGLTTTTTENGGYSLYGVAGQVRLHVKKDGYVNRIETVEVTGHRGLAIEMVVDGERRNLSGAYTLTLTAVCQSGLLPESAQRRSYDATVEQNGPNVKVRLSGATFVLTGGRGDSFAGTVLGGNRVVFTIGSFAYYYWYSYSINQFDIVERMDAVSDFTVLGTVNANTSDTGVSGMLGGTFMTGRASGSSAAWQMGSNCSSSAHRFEMQRR
jgi:hypothetical protein